MSKVYYYCKQFLFYLFLIGYLLLMAKSLLFKQVSIVELFSADRMISRTMNLVPFKTVVEYFSGTNFNIWIVLMNVVGNIVLFIPIGIYLQIFKNNKKFLNCIALVCAISMCVEAIQYVLGIGRMDIDDIILNTFGGLLGIFTYKFLYLLLKDENKTKTAITFIFCLVIASIGVCYFVLVNFLGFRIRIF